MLRAVRLGSLGLLLRWLLCLAVRVVLRRCSCPLARWVLLSCIVDRLHHLQRRRRRVRLALVVRVGMLRRRRRVLWRAWLWCRGAAMLRRRVMLLRLRRRRREGRRVRRRLHQSRHRLRLTRGKWGTTSLVAVVGHQAATTGVFVSWRMRCASWRTRYASCKTKRRV